MNARKTALAFVKSRLFIVLAACYFLLAVLLAACGGPDFTPPCLFKLATGHECFGCGTTRAFMAMLRLEFGAAWGHNPLAFIVLPLGVAAFVQDARRFRRRQAAK